MPSPKERHWLSRPPGTCNICGSKITTTFIDGRVKGHTYWCIMCPDCHKFFGLGLGTGLGQEYIAREEFMAIHWVKTAG